MEKRFFAMLVLVLSAVAFTSCEYDDSGLWDKVNSLEQQVTANQEDIATLTSLVEALNKGKVIDAILFKRIICFTLKITAKIAIILVSWRFLMQLIV